MTLFLPSAASRKRHRGYAVLTFAYEIMAVAAAVEAAEREAAEIAMLPSQAERKRALAEEAMSFRPVIIEFLRNRPPRKRWTTSDEVAGVIGTSANRASQVLLNLKRRRIVTSRRPKGCNTEWRIA